MDVSDSPAWGTIALMLTTWRMAVLTRVGNRYCTVERTRSRYHSWYVLWVWVVAYLPEAERERDKLSAGERHALYNAVAKLEAIGPTLGYPHTSAVQGAFQLRELRLRAGRSPWRALYRQVGDDFVIAAVAPEAQQDPRGFRRACKAAMERLSELEE